MKFVLLQYPANNEDPIVITNYDDPRTDTRSQVTDTNPLEVEQPFAILRFLRDKEGEPDGSDGGQTFGEEEEQEKMHEGILIEAEPRERGEEKRTKKKRKKTNKHKKAATGGDLETAQLLSNSDELPSTCDLSMAGSNARILTQPRLNENLPANSVHQGMPGVSSHIDTIKQPTQTVLTGTIPLTSIPLTSASSSSRGIQLTQNTFISNTQQPDTAHLRGNCAGSSVATAATTHQTGYVSHQEGTVLPVQLSSHVTPPHPSQALSSLQLQVPSGYVATPQIGLAAAGSVASTDLGTTSGGGSTQQALTGTNSSSGYISADSVLSSASAMLDTRGPSTASTSNDSSGYITSPATVDLQGSNPSVSLIFGANGTQHPSISSTSNTSSGYIISPTAVDIQGSNPSVPPMFEANGTQRPPSSSSGYISTQQPYTGEGYTTTGTTGWSGPPDIDFQLPLEDSSHCVSTISDHVDLQCRDSGGSLSVLEAFEMKNRQPFQTGQLNSHIKDSDLPGYFSSNKHDSRSSDKGSVLHTQEHRAKDAILNGEEDSVNSDKECDSSSETSSSVFTELDISDNISTVKRTREVISHSSYGSGSLEEPLSTKIFPQDRRVSEGYHSVEPTPAMSQSNAKFHYPDNNSDYLNVSSDIKDVKFSFCSI